MADTPETLRRVLESDRLDLHTMMPGTVRSYDQAAQTAEITLGVRRVVPAGDDDEADEVNDYPILPAVPVGCLRGSGWFIHVPLRAGDYVVVLFAESDLNEWRRTGRPADPGVSTRHGLSGAVCFPLLHSQRNPLSTGDIGTADEPAMTIGYEGGAVVTLRGAQIEIGGNATLTLSDALDAHLDKIAAGLDALSAIVSSGAPETNYGVIARNLLKISSPIATTIARGS